MTGGQALDADSSSPQRYLPVVVSGSAIHCRHAGPTCSHRNAGRQQPPGEDVGQSPNWARWQLSRRKGDGMKNRGRERERERERESRFPFHMPQRGCMTKEHPSASEINLCGVRCHLSLSVWAFKADQQKRGSAPAPDEAVSLDPSGKGQPLASPCL